MGNPLREDSTLGKGGLIIARDISQRKRKEHQIARFSQRDELTGLLTRTLFLEKVNTYFFFHFLKKNYLPLLCCLLNLGPIQGD